MAARPTAQQERWLAVARRYPALRAAAEARAGGWRSPGLLNRVLMFLLGLLAAALIAGSLLWLPGRGLFAGLAMIAAGELLIRRRQLFAGGIEEALIGAGGIAIVAELLFDASGAQESLLAPAFSLALLAAGLRLGNALFTTLAALGFSVSIAIAGGSDGLGDDRASLAAYAACGLATFAALRLGARRWPRPSHERMVQGLVVAMPSGAFAWALDRWPGTLTTAALAQGRLSVLLPALTALALALLLLATGIRRRDHAPLVGALLQLACLGYALRAITGLPLHGRLLLGGIALLAAGVAIDRALHRPRRGVTSAALGPDSVVQDLAGLAGAAHATPAVPAPVTGNFEGHGGGFAGGGASGRY